MLRVNLQSRVRHLFLRGASRFAHRGDDPLPDLRAMRRVLIVYVNFRLGNTVVATAAVDALTRALPDAHIDLAGGPSAPAVFTGYRIGRIHVTGRHDYWNPLRVGSLVRDLRRGHYEAAVHMSTTNSGIGAFTCRASGAPVRVGCRRPQGNVYFTSTVEAPPLGLHKIDRLNAYVQSLGVEADGGRRMILRPEEQQAASAFLKEHSDADLRVALFVSGRAGKGKNWNEDALGRIATGLRERALEPVVIFGPEERRRSRALKALLGDAVYVQDKGIREVAAIVGQCNAAIAPDSGPMHLAIAVGTRTVALFRRGDHAKWGPQPGEGFAIHDPTGRAVQPVLDAVPDALRVIDGRLP